MAVTLTPDGYRWPPTALITSPQDLTAGWADLGGEIKTDGYRYFTLWIFLDINVSNNARFQLLAKIENGGTHEFDFPISSVGSSIVKLEDEDFEFNVDADQKMIKIIDLKNTIPWVQVQVMAGTVGGTAGQIDGAWYSMGK